MKKSNLECAVYWLLSALITLSSCEKENRIFDWISVNNGLCSPYFADAAIDPHTGYLYVASENIFISSDNGNSWKLVGDTKVLKFEFNSVNVYAITADGKVLTSANSGNTWSNFGESLPEKIRSIAFDGNNIFASTRRGIFLSSDNGVTWAAVNNDPFKPYLGNLFGSDMVVNIMSDENYLIASIQNHFFISEDAGSSWTEIKKPFPGTDLYIRCIASLNNNIFIGMNGDGIFRSTDKGSSWVKMNEGFLSSSGNVSSITVSHGIIFASTSGGIYRSSDEGNSWTPVNKGLSASRLLFHTIESYQGRLISKTSSGVFFSSDYGNNWSDITFGLSTDAQGKKEIFSVASGTNDVFIGTYGDGVFVTKDNGGTWVALNNGLTGSSISARVIRSLCVHDNILAAGTDGSGIFISTDLGNSWEQRNNGLFGEALKVLAIAFLDDYALAGTAGGLYISNDGLNSWNKVKNGLPELMIQAIIVNEYSIFLGTNDGVYKSSDGGNTWTATDEQGIRAGPNGNGIFISEKGYWSIVVVAGEKIFQGTLYGINYSIDGGRSWISFDNGFMGHAQTVYSLTVKGDYIFAATSEGVGRCRYQK